MNIFKRLFAKKHDWRWGSVPVRCNRCGVERHHNGENDNEPCPERAK